MIVIASLSSHARQTEPDPDLKGQYGSNRPAMADDLASPKPGDAGEPWSHYLNPLAHPGVDAYINVGTSDRGSGRTYGETVNDGYPLKPLPGKAKKEAYDSNWSTKSWDVGTNTFQRRRVTLKSGASLVIFRPMGTPADPDACLGAAGVYDRDALFVPVGYQGDGFELVKAPPSWPTDPESDYEDPYDPGVGEEFGYEIELSTTMNETNFDDSLGDVYWIRQGSVESEALERGMTLVYVHLSLGQRPYMTHLAQLIEAAKWMDGCGYAKSCNQFPPQTTYRHRNFIYGGSYSGAVARIAATYMPWVFRGAISEAGSVDQHAIFGWQPVYEYLQDQLLGSYPGGFTKVYDLVDADVLSLFADLEHGYAGGQSIAAVPVDVAGAGLFVWDLSTPQLDNDKLIVPLVLVHGDDDQSQYSFFGADLETELSLGDSSALGAASFTGTVCGRSNPVAYTGVVVERRVPNECHNSLARWNGEEHLAGDGLLDLLMEQVAAQPLEPIPFASSNPSGDIEWSVRASGTNDPHVASVFRDEFLSPRIVEMPEAVFGTGFTCPVEVVADDWPILNDVCEGLGMPDSIVVGDLDDDGDVELVAGTARGDVVKLRFATDGNNLVESVDFIWRRRVSDFPSVPQLAAATDYFGPSEVLLDEGDQIMVAHTFGPVWRIDPASDDPTTAALVLDDDHGKWLRGLRRSGSTFSLINDEGELLRFDSSGTLLSDSVLEGGAGPVLPLGTDAYVYASAHGNVKRTEIVGSVPAHPKSEASLSEHLYGIPRILLDLDVDIGTAAYLAWTDHVILLDANLAIVGMPVVESPPEGLHEAGTGSAGQCVGFWSEVPSGITTNDPGPLEIPIVAATTVSTSAVTFQGYVRLPAPATALAPFGATATARPSGPHPDFTVEWVATLQTGQVALIGDLSSASGDVSASRLAVFREAYGNTFGMATLDQMTAQVHVVGPQGKAWSLDVDADLDGDMMTHVIEGSVPNAFHGGQKYQHGPFRGAVEVMGQPYGLPDGGDRYEDGPWVAMPFSSPYLQADAAVEPQTLDPLDFEAGVMVVDVTQTSDIGDDYFSVQNALLCSTYLKGGKCKLTVADSVIWKSTVLTSNLMVGSVEDDGLILRGFGNACRWADLDGVGAQDLVVATHGGRVMWFLNKTSDSIPDLSTNPSGEAMYLDPGPDLGWDGDLGTTIMAMEIANLDGDTGQAGPVGDDDEFLVGTFFDVDPAHPEHYRMGGSVYVFDKSSGGQNLVQLDALALDFGVCGLHRIPYSGAGDQVHYFVAGTARGRIYLLQYVHDRPGGDPLQVVYRSRFFAPMAGAYNSIRSFLLPGTTDQFRVVFGSSGGIFALDFDLPASFTPGLPSSCP